MSNLLTMPRPTGPIIPSVDRLVSITTSDGSPSTRVEPITLDEAKLHLRVTSSSEDAIIRSWIAAARAWFEEQTGRQIINAVWEYALDQPPNWPVIELPRPPLVSVDSVVYDDGDGNEVTMSASDYIVHKSGIFDGSPESGVLDDYAGCGSIELASGTTWPTTSALSRSFRVRRICGYGATAEEVPGAIKAALYFLVGHFYRNRSEVTVEAVKAIPLAADALIRNFKYRALPTLAPRSL